MKLLQNKTNVEAPTVAFPYGKSKDNTGTNNGTPVDVERFNDWDQFFERIFGFSGIAANGLEDSATNNFQLFEAFLSILPKKYVYETTTILDGDVKVIPRADLETARLAYGSADLVPISKPILAGAASWEPNIDFQIQAWVEYTPGEWRALNGSGTGQPGWIQYKINNATGDITATLYGAPFPSAVPVRFVIIG